MCGSVSSFLPCFSQELEYYLYRDGDSQLIIGGGGGGGGAEDKLRLT